MLLTKFGKFSIHCFFKYDICPFSSSYGTLNIHTLVSLMVFHRSLRLCTIFFILFPYLRNWIIIINIPLGSLILSFTCSNLLLKTYLVNFLFYLVYFLTPEFPFGSLSLSLSFLLNNIYWFIDIFLFGETSFLYFPWIIYTWFPWVLWKYYNN